MRRCRAAAGPDKSPAHHPFPCLVCFRSWSLSLSALSAYICAICISRLGLAIHRHQEPERVALVELLVHQMSNIHRHEVSSSYFRSLSRRRGPLTIARLSSDVLCLCRFALAGTLAGLCMAYLDQPTEPSRLMPISFCVSALNSIGRCCSTSRTKPLTISAIASSALKPRCLQ